MPAGPTGSETDRALQAQALAGAGSLVSHWDTGVPSAILPLGLWGWDFDRVVAPVKPQENKGILGLPHLHCSFALPWQWGGWGGRKVLSHKLTESSGTLIKINIQQFSHWTTKCSRSFSEGSCPVSKNS